MSISSLSHRQLAYEKAAHAERVSVVKNRLVAATQAAIAAIQEAVLFIGQESDHATHVRQGALEKVETARHWKDVLDTLEQQGR